MARAKKRSDPQTNKCFVEKRINFKEIKMGIHQKIATTVARIAGAIPVVKNYDMEGNLHLVVLNEDQTTPHSYGMDGRLEPIFTERIIERGFLSFDAAGISCCAH